MFNFWSALNTNFQRGISSVGTNFWLKNCGNEGTFLENLFRILKKPFDVKRSPDSKYSSLMNVARREGHDFSILKHQKVINPRFEGVLHETLKISRGKLTR